MAFADNADFFAMAKEPLAIQTVAHQVYLRLDEEGTEAAAATGVGMRAVGRLVFQGITMNVDRPFLLLIRDRPTGALLFLARVEDPTAAP